MMTNQRKLGREGFGEGTAPNQDKLRLGAISFINTVPIYSQFVPDARTELVYQAPATLNRMMANGELDVSPVSSAFYLQNKDKLVLLEDLSVSSPGAVESVLFLSRKSLGPELLDSSTISVPDDSETSVALLAYLLKQATGEDLQPWFETYPAGEYREILEKTGPRNSDSLLVIGDNALLIHEQGIPAGYYCYDLSTLWKAEKELPFVFAVWVANRGWAEANPKRLEAVNQALVEARKAFFEKPELFEHGVDLAKNRCRIPEERIRRYFTVALAYDLNEKGLESMSRFEEVLKMLKKQETPSREQQPSF
jgi:chorismate dehydratase